MDGGHGPLSFLGRRLGPAFETTVVTIAPGCSLAYEEADWRDAIVVLERGKVELEGRDGGRLRFAQGDVLWLEGLPLRALRNHGSVPAVLAAVARTAAVSRSRPCSQSLPPG